MMRYSLFDMNKKGEGAEMSSAPHLSIQIINCFFN